MERYEPKTYSPLYSQTLRWHPDPHLVQMKVCSYVATPKERVKKKIKQKKQLLSYLRRKNKDLSKQHVGCFYMLFCYSLSSRRSYQSGSLRLIKHTAPKEKRKKGSYSSPQHARKLEFLGTQHGFSFTVSLCLLLSGLNRTKDSEPNTAPTRKKKNKEVKSKNSRNRRIQKNMGDQKKKTT